MKILIVDDERNIRFILRDILTDEGYKTVQVESGEEALKRLKAEDFQLVILDVKLPGMDGIETYQALKKIFPDLDVIMISGHSGIETAVKAVKLGAYDFLEKPISLAKILTATRNVSERHKLLTRIQQKDAIQNEKYQLIGKSPGMQELRSLIDRVAPTNSKVLIRGESGTGKELVAFALHHKSQRLLDPYITFNSAAIPSELVESELFGHEKGAFTGAASRKQGKLELAHGGTLFLDEIGDMSLSVQTKILRVIQEGTFERVGGNKTLKIDLRILAATHKDLEKKIHNGSFREDLFYRLNIIPILVPPLRERKGDILLLADHFLQYYARELKIPLKTVEKNAQTLLEQHLFPGNVRELKNLFERLSILVSGNIIKTKDLIPYLESTDKPTANLPFLATQNYKEARMGFEKYYLENQLKNFRWKISTVANKLGIKQPNLSRKIKELGIREET